MPPQRRAVQQQQSAAAASSRLAPSEPAPRAPGGAPIVSEPDVELQPVPVASKPPSPAATAASAALVPPAKVSSSSNSTPAVTVPAAAVTIAPVSVLPPPQPKPAVASVLSATSSQPALLPSAQSQQPAAPPRQLGPAGQVSQPVPAAQQPASSVPTNAAVRVPLPVPAAAVASSSSTAAIQPAASSLPQHLLPASNIPQPASVVIHPLGQPPAEEQKQDSVQQPQPDAAVEAKEAVDGQSPPQQIEQQRPEEQNHRSTGTSSFWSFLLCGCGSEATEPPRTIDAAARPQPSPQPNPAVAMAHNRAEMLPVVPNPIAQQHLQQQAALIAPAAAVDQSRPAPPTAPVNVQQPLAQPQPVVLPVQPASVVVSTPVPAAHNPIPVAAPVKSSTSATAATTTPAVQPSQLSSSAPNSSASVTQVSHSHNVPEADEPVQLMHPVYSHLPLLNIPASSLSLYPPHRPPVPDPTEQRAFAMQRQLPLPKPLAAPVLLSSLTDPFIPSSTSDAAFQSTADWSYALLLDIQHACRQTRERFMDNSYPPSHESLFAHYEPKFDTPESQLYNEVSGGQFETGVRWCRASEMQKPNFTSLFTSWRVMSDTIAASDVRQGQLGTCYLTAAICSLVDRYPQFVRSLFLTPDYSAEGVYQIRLCRDGVWRVVTIDDYLPCMTDSNSFRFTHAVDAQLWPALLEKAYSKVYGSYKALESGLPHEVLADLTGSPGFRVDMHPTHVTAVGKAGGPSATGAARSAPLAFVDEQSELDVLWLQMLEWKSRGYLFCASCDYSHRQKTHSNRQYQYATSDEAVWDSDEAWQHRYAQLGLVTSHAYSVLDVVDVEGGVRLVKCRNPWARFVWKGPWSAGPQTKEQKEREQAAQQAEEKKRAEQKVAEQKRREEAVRKPEPKTWKELMKGALSSVMDSVSDASSSASAYYPAAPGRNATGGVAAVREDKGLFWMRWEDFTTHFSTVRACLQQYLVTTGQLFSHIAAADDDRLCVSVFVLWFSCMCANSSHSPTSSGRSCACRTHLLLICRSKLLRLCHSLPPTQLPHRTTRPRRSHLPLLSLLPHTLLSSCTSCWCPLPLMSFLLCHNQTSVVSLPHSHRNPCISLSACTCCSRPTSRPHSPRTSSRSSPLTFN